jgi:hypothetical protein
MITLGVDLASQPRNTAACLIDWSSAPARPTLLGDADALDDRRLVALISRADVARVGIDAPFGFPVGFLDALVAYDRDGSWPADDSPQATRDLRFRATDLYVQGRTGKWPLSPVAERIGIVAMRCARLLAQTPGPIDRTGAGRYVEVYPAAAIALWLGDGVRRVSYKGTGADRESVRDAILTRLQEQLSGQLLLSADALTACRRSDHNLDALICAMLARAAECGSLELAPGELADQAQREGWICFPRHEGRLGSDLSR